MTTFAEITTLGVGGSIAAMVEPADEGSLAAAIAGAGGREVLVMGGGSNLVCGDSPFEGLVVRVRSAGVRVVAVTDEAVEVEAAAGEPWEPLVERAVAEGWSGIEALSGIPGQVGAAPVQNIGAYGQELASVVAGVRVLDRHSGRIKNLQAADCGFGYRTSIFKQQPGRFIVTALTLRLRPESRAQIRYDQLAAVLGLAVGDRAELGQIREAVLALRRSKGMVLDPKDADSRSVGSFFVNPVLPQRAQLPAGCPRYPAAEGGIKLSAAWLIEAAGIQRGWALAPDARARISTKHTLAIVNAGGASCDEVMALADAICARVRSAFGIELMPEPTLVGCALRP